jgi:hypothetical protein
MLVGVTATANILLTFPRGDCATLPA